MVICVDSPRMMSCVEILRNTVPLSVMVSCVDITRSEAYVYHLDATPSGALQYPHLRLEINTELMTIMTPGFVADKLVPLACKRS